METATSERRPPARALAPERTDAPSTADRIVAALPGVAAALVIIVLGVADGGYYATSWGPLTIFFLAAALAGLVLRAQPSLGLLSLTMPALLVLLALWTLASSWWGSPSEAVPEGQRTFAYASGALALAVVMRPGRIVGILVGLWAGIVVVCSYGLATRLFPEHLAVFDPIAAYRLSAPIGYWNALGLLASLGMLFAVGLATKVEMLVVRLAAAASIVPLALTCYFTFSRGAWLALVAGFIVALVLDPGRLRLSLVACLLAPWPILAVVIASTSGPLTERGGYTLAAAAEDGRGLAAVGVGLALFAAGAVAVASALEPRIRVSQQARRVATRALLGGIAVLFVAGLVALGGPSAISDSFKDDPPTQAEDLDERLFSLSGTGRALQWRMALDDARESPILGSGAGSYLRYWLEHRPLEGRIRDAHSLYLETLAELGPLGVTFVIALFGIPLLLAVRLRERPLVPIAAGALVAYLVHAGVDWDWELPILALVAIACGVAIVGERGEPAPSSRARRLALIATIVLLVPLVAVTTVGNRAQAESTKAFDARDYDRAASEARTAERFAPWSVEPLVLLGRAQAAAGERGSARVTLRRAVAREPQHWRAWLELAAASSGSRREAALDRARALNPLEHLIRVLEQSS